MNRVKINRQHKRRCRRLLNHALRCIHDDALEEAERAIRKVLHLTRDPYLLLCGMDAARHLRGRLIHHMRLKEKDAAKRLSNALKLQDAGLLDERFVDEIRADFYAKMEAVRDATLSAGNG